MELVQPNERAQSFNVGRETRNLGRQWRQGQRPERDSLQRQPWRACQRGKIGCHQFQSAENWNIVFNPRATGFF